MGCISSKQFRKGKLRERWTACPRSVTMPVCHPPEREGDSYHFVSLTWSSYGALNVDNPAQYGGSFLGFHKETSNIGTLDVKLNAVKEDDVFKTAGKDKDIVSINTWDLMEGLEGGLSPPVVNNYISRAMLECKNLGRSVSFNTVKEVAAHYSRNGSPKQKSIVPLKKVKLSFHGDDEQFLVKSMEDTESLHFDPVIMATFEKALDSLPVDDSPITSEYTASLSSSLENASNSSDTSSDAESPRLKTASSEWNMRKKALFTFVLEGRMEKSRGMNRSISKVLPVDYEDDWKMLGDLETFEQKCPPGGVGKVVLYVTSMRGVRKTYEDCCELKLIIRGTGVRVDERDVWMHSEFKQELVDMFGKPTGLPRLFIKGRYIGGAEQVRRLHEDGVLAKLLDGLPVEASRQVCDGCGDVRFVPCLACNGACKVVGEDNVVSRCTHCNENGLIMCPVCL